MDASRCAEGGGMKISIRNFMQESNRIEGIYREPFVEEMAATEKFCALERITISDLVDLVKVYQPNAVPRFSQGLNVRVGKYVPPSGGPHIQSRLQELLDMISDRYLSPYDGHIGYEKLHPFTDGNGRSGRAVWLWAMGGIHYAPLGFLHHFYYQTLQNSE